MPSKKVLHLVSPSISKDCEEAVEALLEKIRAGTVVGVAFVAMQSVTTYEIDIAGTCNTYRAATRGMLAALDDALTLAK